MRGPHQHVVVYFEVLHQDVEHAPRHPLLDLEQGRRAVPQLAQPLIDGFEQVVGLVFLDHHVGIADDAEDVRALDDRAREERLDVGAHDVLDEHERGAAAGKRRGELDEAWKHGRKLDARELRASLVLDRDREVLAAVGDVRERMPGVERQRRQDGRDLALKVAGEVRREVLGVVGGLEELDPVRGQLRPQRVGPALGLLVEHLARPRADERELLLGGQAVGRHVLAVGAHLLLQHRHANHEELVEVSPDDGEELDAFEHRVAAVARLVEHALVERQPAELAVQVERWRVERGKGSADAAGSRPNVFFGSCHAHLRNRQVVYRDPMSGYQ